MYKLPGHIVCNIQKESFRIGKKGRTSIKTSVDPVNYAGGHSLEYLVGYHYSQSVQGEIFEVTHDAVEVKIRAYWNCQALGICGAYGNGTKRSCDQYKDQ